MSVFLNTNSKRPDHTQQCAVCVCKSCEYFTTYLMTRSGSQMSFYITCTHHLYKECSLPSNDRFTRHGYLLQRQTVIDL